MKITQDIRDYSAKISIVSMKDIANINKSLD